MRVIQGCITITGDGKQRESGISIADLQQLREMLDEMPDCRAIIIDPISSYMPERAWTAT